MNALFRKLALPFLGACLGLALGLALRPAPEDTPPTDAAIRPPEVVPGPRDPVAAALASALSCQNLRDLTRLGPLLEKLTAAEMGTLLDRLEQHSARLPNDLLELLVSWWTHHDPTAATAWLQPKLTQFLARPANYLNDAVYAWAIASPKLAMDFLRQHAANPGIAGLLRTVIHWWPEQSVSARVALLRQFPAGYARRTVLADVMKYSLHSPEEAHAAIAWANGMERTEREAVLGGILTYLATTEPREALDAAAQLGLQSTKVWADLVKTFAKVEPAATAAWLEAAGGSLFTTHAVATARMWVEKDARAALTWAASHQLLSRLDPLADEKAVAETWSDFRFGESDYLQKAASPTILGKALKEHSEATLVWLGEQPPGAARNALVESATLAIQGMTLHAGSASFFAQVGPLILDLPPEAAGQSAYQLTRHLGADTLGNTAAIDWARSLPAGLVRARAWEGIGESASELPPLAVLPAGPDRDAALTGAAWRELNAMDVDFTPALQHIAQITDPALRKTTFDTIWANALPPQLETEEQITVLRKTLTDAPAPEAWKLPWRNRLDALEKAGAPDK